MAIQRWRPTFGLVHRSPFSEMEEMGKSFESIFGPWLLHPSMRRWPIEETGWAPAIDIFDRGNNLVVKAELPGMKQEDIDVSVVGDTLTIKGERNAESEVKEENYYCNECSYGTFTRSMTLPSHVDSDRIEATYEDGVLEINLPKVPEVTEKKVRISTKKGES